MDIRQSFFYFCQQKRYAQALHIALKYEELQTTKEYKELYTHFLERLKLAIYHIKHDRASKAQQLIEEFAVVEEQRSFIRLLLLYKQEFLVFIERTIDGDVIEAYKIAQKDPRYKDLTIYKELIVKIERTLKRIEDALNRCEVENLEEILLSMQPYPHVKKLLAKLYDTKEFCEAFSRGELQKCYMLIDRSENLMDNLLTKRLEEQWQRRLLECELGSLEQCLEVVYELLSISSRQKILGEVLKNKLLQSIDEAIETKEFFLAERMIYLYEELFSCDEALCEYKKRFEKVSKTALALIQKQGGVSWREVLSRYITS